MSHRHHEDDELVILYLAKDAVITNAVSPQSGEICLERLSKATRAFGGSNPLVEVAEDFPLGLAPELLELLAGSLVEAKEELMKSHRGRCGKNGPRARRLGASIPAVGCKCQANTAYGLLSPQPYGLKSFVDFCGVVRSGETAAGIAQHSRLQKSATALQRPL